MMVMVMMKMINQGVSENVMMMAMIRIMMMLMMMTDDDEADDDDSAVSEKVMIKFLQTL